MEITVIDDSDIVGWAASATRIGEIYMTSAQSMVQNVLTRAAGKRITRLNILDHGNSGTIQLGADRIRMDNLGQYERTLGRLHGHFAAGGFVHLQHCQIGQNQSLLLALSRIWGVPVYAGTGNHNPVYRFNFGDYVRCGPPPTGVCATNVPRPGSPPPANMTPRYLGMGAYLGRDGIIRQGAGPKL